MNTVIFLGSKPIGYECLSHLIASAAELDLKVIGVLTQARKEFGGDNDLAGLATAHNIPVLNSLDELPECDLLYSVQYHEILKQEHINKATKVAVNLHMAPLPEYRGSNQFSFAIIEGRSEFGTTIHQMDARIDHGDILFQKRFPINDNWWVDDLYKATFDASLNLFRQTLKHLVTGNYKLLSQQSLLSKYGTSLHMRSEMAELKKIDLSWSHEKIERHIRATSMPGFEPPYCVIGTEKVYFTRKRDV